MPALTTQQRNTLESAVKKARQLAETGARNALQTLAVNHPEPFAHMSTELRALRNRLRSKARLLGDELLASGVQQIEHLTYELAYEYWHKMLFAKFLESNGLLMHPDGVAVTMEECEELARDEKFIDKWDAAANYASKMLPAIFRPEDPLMQIFFATEDRIKLEELLDGLDNYVFSADDALGWVYQFWQSEAKEAINKSGDKIDGEKLPAVTQLFTEPYMVHFLIDNTIGAWWVSRHSGKTPPVKFEYLRLLDDGTPAAGKFEGWPTATKEITSLDPCMGSGHFIVTLFTVFARLRMYEEGLSKEEAADKVIKENLHGLELDARCTQIAAFNLALTAWKFCSGNRPLPEMNLACSGIAPKGKKEDWVKLVGKVVDPVQKARMENGMKVLYDHFQLAPELGSLLDPGTIKPDAFTASFEELQPTLIKALENEMDKDQIERGVIAAGIAKSGKLLAKKYNLSITNVPFLGNNKMSDILFDYCETYHPSSKKDLSTVFIDRIIKILSSHGISACVSPQSWYSIVSYKKFREGLLKRNNFLTVVDLGINSFKTPMYQFNVALTLLNKTIFSGNSVSFIDLSSTKNILEKEEKLKNSRIAAIKQEKLLSNPDFRIMVQESRNDLLSKYATANIGMQTGDNDMYVRSFWEIELTHGNFEFFQRTSAKSCFYDGLEQVIFWEKGKGRLVNQRGFRDRLSADIIRKLNLAKQGFVIHRMGNLPCSIAVANLFDQNGAILIPIESNYSDALWCYVQSVEFAKEVRILDKKVGVNPSTLIQVPFDYAKYKAIAEAQYPKGLPKPYSNDPTQWIFHGHPVNADNPLQVAVARLLGYRWPAESDTEMELANEARELIQQIKAFDGLTDEDGILCIPSVNGELAASERLRSNLQAVYDKDWNNQTLAELLKKEGSKKSNLDEWLRDEFFEQHNKLFQHRPFIWHIWDGRKDGFSALVDYHKLNKENLQRLIYTYLGDWIRQCEAKKKAGESGAEGLLSAALKLKEKLEAILEGETPYDIFVRWKPLAQQPIGWEPDLNDGVRLNIRPFITAEVLRKKPNIKWGIDRGKNPPVKDLHEFPKKYFSEIRDNDMHISLEEKRAARK